MRFCGLLGPCGARREVDGFRTVSGKNKTALDAKVSIEVDKGWQPIGGVAQIVDGKDTVLLMALVRYKK